ncbi:MAG: PCMD domain-containing protein [Bradyrhizobiaceae bacterium]|nr:PCMD domain-containing protein [Bradyrhizobiaceae bacterium]
MRIVGLLVAFASATMLMYGQQVANTDFEDWTLTKGSGQYKDYEEPSHGWASGNGAIHIAAGSDPVCEKSTDAASGAYSAKLTTRKIFGQIASGSLYTGKFALNLADPVKSAQRGIPFSGRPVAFKGWYKYAPVDADSATLYAVLSYWDGQQRVPIAEARILEKEARSTWYGFEIPFTYTSDKEADTIALVFASSAGGEFFKGSVGSTLYVDDVSLVYGPVSVDDSEVDAADRLSIVRSVIQSTTPMQWLGIYAMDGTLQATWNNTMFADASHLQPGVYCLVADTKHGVIRRTFCVY